MTHTLQANPIRMRQGASALIALLLYHPTEIHSRQRKTSQCVLLQAQIRAAQTGFNEHLDKVLQRKSDDIGVSDRERRGGGGGGGGGSVMSRTNVSIPFPDFHFYTYFSFIFFWLIRCKHMRAANVFDSVTLDRHWKKSTIALSAFSKICVVKQQPQLLLETRDATRETKIRTTMVITSIRRTAKGSGIWVSHWKK